MDITNTGVMEEKEMLKDVLTSQKLAASTYSSFAGECATSSVRSDFLTILQEEHDIEMDIFTEMHTRGYYPTPLAEQQKITEAKNKYSKTMP